MCWWWFVCLLLLLIPYGNLNETSRFVAWVHPKEERASIVAFVYAFLKELHGGTKVAKSNFITCRRVRTIEFPPKDKILWQQVWVVWSSRMFFAMYHWSLEHAAPFPGVWCDEMPGTWWRRLSTKLSWRLGRIKDDLIWSHDVLEFFGMMSVKYGVYTSFDGGFHLPLWVARIIKCCL